MGLNDLEDILEKLWTLFPSAFLESMPFMKAGHTIISDGLMRLKFATGPKFNNMFTGHEFYTLVTDVIFSALRSNCGTWIECFDIGKLVPTQKDEERKRRRDAAAKAEEKNPGKAPERYPIWAEFCDAGIIERPGAEPKPFDNRGVIGFEPLRNKLLQYVIDRLRSEGIPYGTQIIFDFKFDAPVSVVRKEVGGSNHVSKLDKYSHLFGEADLQMPMWAWIFRHNDVEIRSGDTDTLPIICALVEQANPAMANQVIWTRGRMKGSGQGKKRAAAKAKIKRLLAAQAKGRRLHEKVPEIVETEAVRTHHRSVDFKAIVNMLSMRGISMKTFIMIVCHGTGSDFNLKTRLAHQTNIQNIFTAIEDKQIRARIEAIHWSSFALVKRDQGCVWEQILGNKNMLGAGLVYDIDEKNFKEWNDQEYRNYGAFDDDREYRIAEEALLSFWRGIERRQSVEYNDAEEKLGVLCSFWATQYWMFPFSTLIKIGPPPAFEPIAGG